MYFYEDEENENKINNNKFFNHPHVKEKQTPNLTSENTTEKPNLTNEEKAKNTIDKYSSFNDDQILNEIANGIKAAKQAGTYDKNAILSQINAVSFLLGEEKVNRIKQLLDSLDGE
jgi:hypothetical protein